MKKIVLITSLDSFFGERLAAVFAREGFEVFALGNKPIEKVTLLPLAPYEAAVTLKEKTGKLDFFLDTSDVRSPEDTAVKPDASREASLL